MSGDSLTIPAHAEHYSVVLLKERAGPYLLQRRARGRSMLYAGRLSLFGGRREADDSPEATAIREVEEECGIALTVRDLTLLARLLAHDEWGSLSYGSIYFCEDLPKEAVRAALNFRSAEGRAERLLRRDIGRRSHQLTSIAHYALAAHADYEKADAPAAKGANRR